MFLRHRGSVGAVSDEASVGIPDDVFALLCSVWAMLRERVPAAAELGARWSEMSTAFVVREGGTAIAHAGVLEIPMIVAGETRRAAGIHAVCTAEGHRGRGHARRVIERAIAHAEQHADLVLLHASDPEIYTQFGFRPVEQRVFHCERPEARAAPMRQLAATAADVALVRRLSRGRAPVSEALGIGDAADLFVLDECLACGTFARLWYAEDLDVVVALDVADRVAQIYDVVGTSLPPLAEITARIVGRFDRVELFFAPDRFAQPRWRMRAMEPPDVFMVRGAFAPGAEIAVPPLARC